MNTKYNYQLYIVDLYKRLWDKFIKTAQNQDSNKLSLTSQMVIRLLFTNPNVIKSVEKLQILPCAAQNELLMESWEEFSSCKV